MNFTKLEINNFLTIGHAKVDLDGRGLLLIQGVNADDPSAESNGAGKSSIVDALCWALYGTTARGVTGDAVVNKTAKANCCVTVQIVDGSDEYMIKRFRKDKIDKNQVLVYKRDPDPACAGIDMSKGTDKETQEVINKILGCSLDVFMAAVYSGQEMMPDLPGMTDKMLKVLIEEAAGVGVLTEAYAVAKSRHTAIKSQHDNISNSLSRGVVQAAALAADLAMVRANGLTFDLERKDRAKAELAHILPLKSEIVELEKNMAVYDSAASVQLQLNDLNDKLAAQSAEQAKLDTLNLNLKRAETNVTTVKMRHEAAKLAVEKASKAIHAVDDQIGKSCKECGKTYHAADLCDVKAIREDDVVNAISKIAPLFAELESADKCVKTASDAAETFKATMTDVSAVAARQRDLNTIMGTLRRLTNEVVGLNAQIEKYTILAKSKLTEANPWAMAEKGKERDVDLHDVFMRTTTEALSAKADELELISNAVSVFGPAGVRAHILDTVTPFLNDRTQEYLGALTDGNIHATWNTLTKTAKGELREKFNIEVTNDYGAESFAGLSGGEKRKVRLATSMALQDMVASRATKPIDIFIGDEIDHALDDAGLERLMTVLERKARERGTVLVISHNSLADWCSNVITVTKSGGYSTLSGENLRT